MQHPHLRPVVSSKECEALNILALLQRREADVEDFSSDGTVSFVYGGLHFKARSVEEATEHLDLVDTVAGRAA